MALRYNRGIPVFRASMAISKDEDFTLTISKIPGCMNELISTFPSEIQEKMRKEKDYFEFEVTFDPIMQEYYLRLDYKLPPDFKVLTKMLCKL